MTSETTSNQFWPDGIRLVISVSMQFGQPSKGKTVRFHQLIFRTPCPPTLQPEAVNQYGLASW